MPVFERLVLDALPLTIYTVDLDGRITSANRSWSQFAAANGAPGIAEEHAVLGSSIWDALRERASRTEVERAMEELRGGQQAVVRWEFPCDSPDEERVFLMQVAPLTDGHTVSGYVFSTVDITASHQSREALIDAGLALARTISLEHIAREVGRQLRRATHGQAVAIALADDDTARLRLLHATGFGEPEDALRSRLTPQWLDALANGRVVLSPSDAGLELTAPMTSAEGVLGAVTVLTGDPELPHRLDEVRRVVATIAAQAAAAIERAWLIRRVEDKRRLEAIGEVATGVAHELRNPLFGISSAAQLLRFRAREDPMVEKNVGRILREVERLNRMVGSLLEFGRPAAPVLAPGDPDAVWDEVLESNRGLLESRSVVVQRTRAEPPARCAMDAEQLRQVFVNVLVNAIDAAPEASDLTLTSHTLANGGWRCRLHNGGPAIPPEALARVFELFFSTRSGGTGIGLALCQRIMDEHHGAIALDSAPEQGTTATLTLPGLADAG